MRRAGGADREVVKWVGGNLGKSSAAEWIGLRWARLMKWEVVVPVDNL